SAERPLGVATNLVARVGRGQVVVELDAVAAHPLADPISQGIVRGRHRPSVSRATDARPPLSTAAVPTTKASSAASPNWLACWRKLRAFSDRWPRQWLRHPRGPA